MSIIPTEARVDRKWYTSTAPTSEPVTLSELKDYAKIDTTAEDAVLTIFLQAAREGAEKYTNRALLPQVITLLVDSWPDDGVLSLPRPPLISVTSVVMIAEDNSETAYSTSDYTVVTGVEPGYIQLRLDSTPPPTVTPRVKHPLKITYQAGYVNAAAVPGAIKIGVLAFATAIYENRVVDIMKPPPQVLALLEPYRLRPIGTSYGR
jgi:uncharacterized phiE125 gp8 family phage protein